MDSKVCITGAGKSAPGALVGSLPLPGGLQLWLPMTSSALPSQLVGHPTTAACSPEGPESTAVATSPTWGCCRAPPLRLGRPNPDFGARAFAAMLLPCGKDFARAWRATGLRCGCLVGLAAGGGAALLLLLVAAEPPEASQMKTRLSLAPTAILLPEGENSQHKGVCCGPAAWQSSRPARKSHNFNASSSPTDAIWPPLGCQSAQCAGPACASYSCTNRLDRKSQSLTRPSAPLANTHELSGLKRALCIAPWKSGKVMIEAFLSTSHMRTILSSPPEAAKSAFLLNAAV
mmetsp:Transcript_58620/g.169662  ORF Transcript_58620/g.169662 Transcript_58620/m.169662 type:complete len:289 (+) Transcript_58620:384-1250(+)